MHRAAAIGTASLVSVASGGRNRPGLHGVYHWPSRRPVLRASRWQWDIQQRWAMPSAPFSILPRVYCLSRYSYFSPGAHFSCSSLSASLGSALVTYSALATEATVSTAIAAIERNGSWKTEARSGTKAELAAIEKRLDVLSQPAPPRPTKSLVEALAVEKVPPGVWRDSQECQSIRDSKYFQSACTKVLNLRRELAAAKDYEQLDAQARRAAPGARRDAACGDVRSAPGGVRCHSRPSATVRRSRRRFAPSYVRHRNHELRRARCARRPRPRGRIDEGGSVRRKIPAYE